MIDRLEARHILAGNYKLLDQLFDERDRALRRVNALESRLARIMPLFQEARDALPAITLYAAKLHGVDLTLADRMDAVGSEKT